MEPIPRVAQATFDAEPSAVRRAWTDPNALPGWLCERATGCADVGCELTLSWPSLGQEITLEVVLATESELCFAATVAGARQLQRVHLSRTGKRTHVTVEHDAPPDMARGVIQGWQLRLFILGRYLRHQSTRTLDTVAGTATGTDEHVFARIAAATRFHLCRPQVPEPERVSELAYELSPDGLCGQTGDGTAVVIRRFSLVAGSHLIAAQTMSWTGADLSRYRPRLQSLVAHASDRTSPTVH